jgi:hypothetical protein
VKDESKVEEKNEDGTKKDIIEEKVESEVKAKSNDETEDKAKDDNTKEVKEETKVEEAKDSSTEIKEEPKAETDKDIKQEDETKTETKELHKEKKKIVQKPKPDKEFMKYYVIYKIKSIDNPPDQINNAYFCPSVTEDIDTDFAYVNLKQHSRNKHRRYLRSKGWTVCS